MTVADNVGAEELTRRTEGRRFAGGVRLLGGGPAISANARGFCNRAGGPQSAR